MLKLNPILIWNLSGGLNSNIGSLKIGSMWADSTRGNLGQVPSIKFLKPNLIFLRIQLNYYFCQMLPECTIISVRIVILRRKFFTSLLV